jgi:ClpP class serine protease
MNRLIALLNKEPLAVEYNYASAILDSIKAGDFTPTDDTIDAVSYRVDGNIASIFVDGAMYKKNIGGLCMSVASYDRIKAYIKDANSHSEVTDVIITVDTPGGSVAGVDDLHNLIKSSDKPIHILAQNLCCSAGMWAFSAGSKFYATETTILGSIGVLTTYTANKDGKEEYKLVSKNAENKVCDIDNADCKDRISTMLDKYEDKFLSRLSEAFEKDKKDIVADFDNGATIFADEAFKLGYLDGIMTYEELFQSLATMPSDEKIVNQKQREIAMETNSNATADLQEAGGEVQAKLEALQGKYDALMAQTELYKQVAIFGAKYKASEDTVSEALEAQTVAEAENVFLKARLDEPQMSTEAIGGVMGEEKAQEDFVYERGV